MWKPLVQVVYVVLFVFVGTHIGAQSTTRTKVQTDQTVVPRSLAVRWGEISEPLEDAVVVAGTVPEGAHGVIELQISNEAKTSLQVDAFNLGTGAAAQWIAADGSVSTRTIIAPKSHEVLRITVTSVSDPNRPGIMLMNHWKQLGMIRILYHSESYNLGRVFNFGPYLSGYGIDKATYHFCAPTTPLGLEIVSVTPTLKEVSDQNDHPRGCNGVWAECPVDENRRQGEGYCFAPWVQGHQGGRGDNQMIGFNFSIAVEYRSQPIRFTLGSIAALMNKSN